MSNRQSQIAEYSRMRTRWPRDTALVLLIAAGIIASCSSHEPAGSSSSLSRSGPIELRQTVLPCSFESGRIILDVIVEDDVPARLLLDSGTPGVLLSQECARSIRRTRLMKQVHAGQTASADLSEPFNRLSLTNLQIGELEIGQLHAQVIDFAAINNAMEMPIDGTIGIDVFDGSVLSLNYPQRRVIHSNVPPAVSVTLLPMLDDVLSVVHARLGGEVVNVLLDTGASPALTLREHTLGAEFDGEELELGPIPTIGGSIRGATLRRLSVAFVLGTSPFEALPVVIMDRQPTVGVPILERFTVHFDLMRRVVILD